MIDLLKVPSKRVPRKIVEEFVTDVRKLCVIYGSQQKLAMRLGLGDRTINRWFCGRGLPAFKQYLSVKELLAEELQRAISTGGSDA